MLLYCKYHCEYFCIILIMFVLWSLVVQRNYIRSQTPIWPLTLFVTSIRQLSRLLSQRRPVWTSHKLFSCRSLCFLVTFPPSLLCLSLSLSLCLSFIKTGVPVFCFFFCCLLPCVSSRWLCSITWIFRCQAWVEAIFPFTLRCIWRWSMLSAHEFMLTFYQWLYEQ